jgi:hypothetical protein
MTVDKSDIRNTTMFHVTFTAPPNDRSYSKILVYGWPNGDDRDHQIPSDGFEVFEGVWKQDTTSIMKIGTWKGGDTISIAFSVDKQYIDPSHHPEVRLGMQDDQGYCPSQNLILAK